ncbi:xanthine dehydrogenase family protein molybdopterin-binding subunit [soil metagenome]
MNAKALEADSALVIRKDGWDKITGSARYTIDIAVDGMLHARVLRSPHAHAKVVSIDASAAEALPGVVTVVTGADIAHMKDPVYGLGVWDQPIIVTDKVRYVGDVVAAVAAVDAATAIRALGLIDVVYEPLPSLMTIDESLAEGAPLMFIGPTVGNPLPVGRPSTMVKDPAPNVLCQYTYNDGDCDALFATAAHVFTDTFHFSAINHFHLEPHVNVASVKGRRIELWSCNQDPFVVRADLARLFERSTLDIAVHASYLGGGFGGKSYTKFEPLTVLVAMKAGRPVRLAFGMDESIVTLTKHAARLTLTTAVSADGILLARRSRIDLDGGAYSDASAMTAVKSGYRITGPYRWKAVDSLSRVVRTTKVPAGSFRGFGGTQASFASESQIDLIARRLNIDPYDFRCRNVLKPGEEYRPGDSNMDSDIVAGLDAVLQPLGYHGHVSGDTSKCLPGRTRGMGMAIGLKDGGGTGNYAAAIVKVMPSGRVFVHAGTVELGQGSGTAMTRIAAEELRVPLEWVEYGTISTNHTPLNNGTNVSCGTFITGSAVQKAAINAREKILAFAASSLQCEPSEVELDKDWSVRFDGQSYALSALIQKHYGGVGFEFVGEGHLKMLHDAESPINAKNPFWMVSWCGAEVEVDRLTGMVKVLQLIVAGDVGTALDLKACLGQIEGAALQAYGQALFEELRFDGDTPANGSPLSYRVPMISDLPEVFKGIVLQQGMGPGPFKLKGIGESGMLSVAAALCNAVHDAAGVRVSRIPLTPDRVLSALDTAEAEAQVAARATALSVGG